MPAMPRRLPRPDVVEALGRVFGHQHHQLHLVGGPVRDLLLGRPIEDLDFTTSAQPELVKRLAREAGAESIFAVGEKFGTIGALFPAMDGAEPTKVEITTYRSESYAPYSRKPSVEFGHSL